MTIVITVTIFVIGVLWLLIRPDMSAVTGGLTTGVAGRKNTLIAIIVIAVGITIVWIWRKTIFAFPSMSALEQTMVLATVLFVGIATYGIWALYQKGDPVWPQRFAVVGMAGILIFGALTWMFGERWVSDPIAQEAFDIRSGEPNYIGYLDSGGIWKRGSLDGELLRLEDCRPKGTNHSGFDYAKNGTCFSPVQAGVRMVPISDDNVPILPDTRLFKTPADIKAEKAAEQKRIDAAQQRRVELQRQRELARLEALKPKVTPCTAREFNGFANCNRVSLTKNGYAYSQTKTATTNCLGFDDGRRIERDSQGLTVTYNLKPTEYQATFHIFEMEPGDTYRGDTC